MATNIGSLAVQITGNSSGLSRELKKTESDVSALKAKLASDNGPSLGESIVGNIAGGLTGLFNKLTSLPALITGGLVGFSLGAIVTESVKLASEVEDTQTAFKVMLGDAGKAKSLFADIRKLASETPLTANELTDSAKLLLGSGVDQNQIIPTMRVLGDVAAGAGQQLKDVALIYNQVRTKGKLYAEELMQFNERNIPLQKALADAMKVSDAEVTQLISEGKVGFPDLQRAMAGLTSEGGRFFNMMQERSQTLSGLWSTLKDNVQQLGAGLGQIIIEEFGLKSVVQKLSELAGAGESGLDKLRPLFRDIKDALVTGGERFYEAMFASARLAARIADNLDLKWKEPTWMTTARVWFGPDINGIGFQKKDKNEQAVLDLKKETDRILGLGKSIINDIKPAPARGPFRDNLIGITGTVFEATSSAFARHFNPNLGGAIGAMMASSFANEVYKKMPGGLVGGILGGASAVSGKNVFQIEPNKLNGDQIKWARGIQEQMNPLDQFKRRIGEIQDVWKLGGLKPDEQAFALAQAFKDAAKNVTATGTQFASAMERGSTEAASIRIREQYGQGPRTVEDILKSLLEQQKREVEASKDIAKKLDKAGWLQVK